MRRSSGVSAELEDVELFVDSIAAIARLRRPVRPVQYGFYLVHSTVIVLSATQVVSELRRAIGDHGVIVIRIDDSSRQKSLS